MAERLREITEGRGVDRVLEVDLAGNGTLAAQEAVESGQVMGNVVVEIE